MRKVLSGISLLLVIVTMILAFFIVGIRLFGIDLYVVLSPSMEPTLQTGSVVYVKDATADQIEKDDIITFTLDADNLATHRVIDVIETNGKRSFQTKGDANSIPDSKLVQEEQIRGKVLFSIPRLGKVVEYIHTPKGRLVAIAAGAGLVLFVALTDVIAPKKKEEEEKKEDSEDDPQEDTETESENEVV